MKKIIIFGLLTFAAFSCNKPYTNYGTSLPYTGLDPFSAIVGGKSSKANIATFSSNTTLSIIAATETKVIAADTTLRRTYNIILPLNGGALNTLTYLDSTNKSYSMVYTETLLKGITEIKSKTFASNYL